MNLVVTLCLIGGGVFLVTFVASLVTGLWQSRKNKTVDEDNNEVQ